MKPHVFVAIAGSAVIASSVVVAALGPEPSVPSYLLNPVIDQSVVQTTICVPGWTATVRPPSYYTSTLKKRQLAGLYPNRRTNPRDFEEDHKIPLELGGAPRAEENLWPQPWPQARKKDLDENRLHKAVCNSTMTLQEAQLEMYREWVK